MKSNQLGTFQISVDMVDHHPEQVAEVFTFMKLVPVRAEQLFANQCIEYTAISELFLEANRAAVIPEYKLIVHTDPETGKITSIEAIKK